MICLKIIFTGGGTAGHINPALAVAKYIRSSHPDWEILFIGTQAGLEKKLVPKEGFNIKYISIRGFRRKLTIDNLVAVGDIFVGMLQAKKIISDFKPDIVIGTGGYVCGPVILNASMMKIPTILHEQNAIPGVTIKMLSRYVDAIAVGFQESRKYLKHVRKVIHTGNPVRQELMNIDQNKAKIRLGLTDKKVILVLGGSLGAKKINEIMVEYIKDICHQDRFYLMFGTGDSQYEKVIDGLNYYGVDIKSRKDIKIFPYIHDMDIYAAADLVICRCGAMTLSEMTVMGKPTILIPYPYAAHNHQEYNARALENRGAAIVFTENELNYLKLRNQVENLLKDNIILNKMGKNSFRMGITNATEKIYNIITDLLKEKAR